MIVRLIYVSHYAQARAGSIRHPEVLPPVVIPIDHRAGPTVVSKIEPADGGDSREPGLSRVQKTAIPFASAE